MSEKVEIPEHNPKDEVRSKFERIKGHVKRNKLIYISGVVVILSRGYFKPTSVNVAEIMTHIRPIGILSKQTVVTNITKVYTHGRGRPGNLVRLAGRPDITYPSQSEAARIFGVSDRIMSDHLNGKIPEIAGFYRLERVLV